MSDVKSDIQIAREAKMQPINDILAKINVPDESAAFSPMGRHIAKINLEYLDTLKDKSDGKLILVTAITPTPAGEGKTTTSVGLNDGLNKIGKIASTSRLARKLFSGSGYAASTWGHQAAGLNATDFLLRERFGAKSSGITPAGRCRYTANCIAYGQYGHPKARIIRETFQAFFH